MQVPRTNSPIQKNPRWKVLRKFRQCSLSPFIHHKTPVSIEDMFTVKKLVTGTFCQLAYVYSDSTTVR